MKKIVILVLCFISQSSFSQTNDTINLNSLIFPRQFKIDTVSITKRNDLIEKVSSMYIVSGTIRFSGTGFPQVVSTVMKNNNMRVLRSFLDRCKSGSRITFEKCIQQRNDGTNTMPINKSIYFQ